MISGRCQETQRRWNCSADDRLGFCNMSSREHGIVEGGGDTGAECVCSARDDFQHAVSRVAVAQLCESVGYTRAQLSAIDALSELAVRYICDIGKVARFYANLSGRTGCSLLDVAEALEDIGASKRGSTAPDGSGCGANSGLVSEIAKYVACAETAPFAGSLPRVPVMCRTKQRPSFAIRGDASPAKHIPQWLPAFPDPHTYFQTPVWNERASEPKQEKIEQARQRRKAERSLLNLQKRLASAGANASSLRNDKMEHITSSVNSSLIFSVESEEGEKTLIHPKDEIALDNKYSVFNVFKPVIDALAKGALEQESTEVLPMERPTYKFSFNKKTLDTQIYLGVHSGRTNSWALGADEKDDKKRRVQLIIRESIDNPQELHQL